MAHIWQAAEPSDHWHLIGQRWRPLHEQLTTLQDVATWTSVSAHAASSRPEAIGPVSVSRSLGMASALHDGDYGLLVVSGELTRADNPRVRAQLYGMLVSGIRHLVVDLSGVDTADPRLGTALDLMYRRLHALNGTLTLVGVPTGLVPLLAIGPARLRETVCAEGAAAPPGRSRVNAPEAVFTAAARGQAAPPLRPHRPPRRRA
jgi:ABC-type transporter Mla MlaB component